MRNKCTESMADCATEQEEITEPTCLVFNPTSISPPLPPSPTCLPKFLGPTAFPVLAFLTLGPCFAQTFIPRLPALQPLLLWPFPCLFCRCRSPSHMPSIPLSLPPSLSGKCTVWNWWQKKSDLIPQTVHIWLPVHRGHIDFQCFLRPKEISKILYILCTTQSIPNRNRSV